MFVDAISRDALIGWANARIDGLESIAPDLLSTLATFALHSTLLLLAVLVLDRSLRLRARSLELLWKLAVILPFATTALARLIPDAGLRLNLDALARTGSEHAAATTSSFTPNDGPAFAIDAAEAAELAMPSLQVWLVLALFAVFALGLLRFGMQRIRLFVWLRARLSIDDVGLEGRVRSIARRIGVDRHVRLSARDALATPVAFGTLRPEICIPPTALARLDACEQDAVLAHELGHIACRDPFWFSLFALVHRLVPWQPLLGIARRRFETLAEYRCDAIAAGVTSRKAVATCLVEVASWILRRDTRPQLVGMAPRPSALRTRVERVLDVREPARFGRYRSLLLPICLLVGSASSFAMPRIAAAQIELVTEPRIQLGDESRELFDALVTIDIQCAELARDFGRLQSTLVDREIDAASLRGLQVVAAHLNQLDTRRIELRKRILAALALEATRFESHSSK